MVLDFPDESFDLVHSSSVVEHVTEPGTVFREMYRVLKPGGLAYHSVDPWFHPRGGHTLCTLDFPWGHVRLSAEEFHEYITRYRPHEAGRALDFYDNYFQKPRLTAAQMESLVIESGFEIKEWRESRSRHEDHYEFIDGSMLDE